MMMKYFTEHPSSVDETYVEHLGTALSFGVAMLGAGLACLIHAVLPFAFVKTGSVTIERLHDRMVVNRRHYPRGRLANR